MTESRSSSVDELAAVIASGPSSISSHGIGVNVGNRQVAMRHIGSHELVKLAGARLQHG